MFLLEEEVGGGGVEEISKRTMKIFKMSKTEAEAQEIGQQLPYVIMPWMQLPKFLLYNLTALSFLFNKNFDESKYCHML